MTYKRIRDYGVFLFHHSTHRCQWRRVTNTRHEKPTITTAYGFIYAVSSFLSIVILELIF